MGDGRAVPQLELLRHCCRRWKAMLRVPVCDTVLDLPGT
jgi:hypothetical protein